MSGEHNIEFGALSRTPCPFKHEPTPITVGIVLLGATVLKNGQADFSLNLLNFSSTGDFKLHVASWGFGLAICLFGAHLRRVKRQRTAWQCVSPAVLVLLAISGCSTQVPLESHSNTAHSIASPTDPITAISPRQLSLFHDFGVLLPNARVRHTFSLVNNTSSPWTIHRIGTSCRCTVVEPSVETINPGQKASFTFEYEAPASRKDDRTAAEIHFHEELAPRVRLEVAATIRELIDINPAKVFARVRKHKSDPVSASVEISNYSGRKWSGIRIRDTPPWLRVGEIVESSRVNLLASFLIPLDFDTDSLDCGSYTHPLEIESPDAVLRVAINLEVLPPYIVIPSQVFFGSVQRGETKKQLIRIRSTESDAIYPDSIIVKHNCGEQLTYEWNSKNSSIATLVVTWSPCNTKAREYIRGRITMTFPDSVDVTLPVYAKNE